MSIDFEVPAEAKAIREKVRQWVHDECIPAEKELDSKPLEEVLAKLRKKARAQGLWCPFVPKEYGGMGLGPLANALVQMELGESMLGALSMNTQGPDDASMMTILEHGTEYQKEKFLKPLLNGDKRICFSMTEKASGADATGMQTTAVKDGNENYILNGEKWFSSSASVADMALVMAKTDPNAPRHKQYSTFIVELPNPGYNIKRNIKNMAIEGPYDDVIHGGHSEIEIKDLKVPADNLLGGEGNGFNMGQHRLAYGRLRHGMHNVAKAQRALDMAVAHVTKRSTFGAAAGRPPGGAVHARRMRHPALYRPADAAAHRLQGGKGHGSAAGEFNRQGVSGAHGAPRDRHRDPAPRRARLQPGYRPGEVVHAGALAAAGRRPGRSAQMEGRPQRHQGVPRARHHGVGRGRRFDLSVRSSFRGGASRRTRNLEVMACNDTISDSGSDAWRAVRNDGGYGVSGRRYSPAFSCSTACQPMSRRQKPSGHWMRSTAA